MIVDSFPDRIIYSNNEPYLYFGGTSYLGMATHPVFQKTLAKNLVRWGSCYGSSRSSNIGLSIYERVESFIAEMTGSESSVTVSSGTLAGKLVVDYFSAKKYRSFHVPGTHPAILSKESLSIIDENGNLHHELTNDKKEYIVITTDAILGMATKPTDLTFLAQISPAKSIFLVLDESHSLGILGNNGWGIFNTIPRDNLEHVILVSSLAKAMGISGGIVASDKDFIEELKKEALFVSSSGANPAYLETLLDTQSVYSEQRHKLKSNLDFLSKHLRMQHKLQFTNNYPVIYSNSNSIFRHLHEKKIVISSFKYPTYTTRMNRIVITSNHTEKDLKKLSDILNTSEL